MLSQTCTELNFCACLSQRSIVIYKNSLEFMRFRQQIVPWCFLLLSGSLASHQNLTVMRYFFQKSAKKKPEPPTPTSGVDRSGYLVSRNWIRCSVACLITDKQAGTAAAIPQLISLAHKFSSVWLPAVYNDTFYGACSRTLPLHISCI